MNTNYAKHQKGSRNYVTASLLGKYIRNNLMQSKSKGQSWRLLRLDKAVAIGHSCCISLQYADYYTIFKRDKTVD